MPKQDTESTMGAALIRIGEIGVAQGDEAALDAYFEPASYVFTAPKATWTTPA